MGSQNDGPTKTYTAGEDITLYALVMIEASTGDVIETTGAGGGDVNVIGAAQAAALDGEPVVVRMLNCVATVLVIADLDDLAVGDVLFTADNGEVTDANTSASAVGVAMEASSAVGDVIEMAVAMQTIDAVDA